MSAKQQNIATRVTPELRAKAEYIAAAERRKLADWARLSLEAAVAAYEAVHGAIVLPAAHPAPPATDAGGR